MPKQPKRRVAIYALLTVVSLIFLTVIILCTPTQHHKNDWNLLRTDEPITELAFAHHADLPKKYTPGDNTTLRFTIHNLEQQDVIYQYEIVQYDSDGKTRRTLTAGDAAVKDGQKHAETISFTYGDAGQRSRIELRLLGQHQTLHYWVERAKS